MISTQWATRHQTIKQSILGSDVDSDSKAWLQQGKFYFPKPHGRLTPKSPPKFRQEQVVCFQGGTGRIDSYYWESGIWVYIVEMALGPEPDTGRVGSETTIVLHEEEVQAVINERSTST